ELRGAPGLERDLHGPLADGPVRARRGPGDLGALDRGLVEDVPERPVRAAGHDLPVRVVLRALPAVPRGAVERAEPVEQGGVDAGEVLTGERVRSGGGGRR